MRVHVRSKRLPLFAIFSLLLFFALTWSLTANSDIASPPLPQNRSFSHSFEREERVEYVASWNGIPLASATVRAAPAVVEGKKLYEVRIAAETWRYLDPIWKMRDTIEASFEAETVHPRSFVFRQRENRRRLDTTATFDRPGKKWLVQRRKGSKVQDYEVMAPNTIDPVTAAYWARTVDFKIGESIPLEVFGGKSLYHVMLNVVGRERVVVKGGAFDAYKIVPKIFNRSREGYAEKLREAVIWISADEAKMPVKIVSQVSIGSVTIEMTGKSSGAL